MCSQSVKRCVMLLSFVNATLSVSLGLEIAVQCRVPCLIERTPWVD